MRGNKEEGGAEKAASGGDKAKDEDASTAPVPERVRDMPSPCFSAPRQAGGGQSERGSCPAVQCQVGGSPVYLVERKLGKGGFGQVYVGRRNQTTTAKDGINANQVT